MPLRFLLCLLLFPLFQAALPPLSGAWPPEGTFELQPQWSNQVELEPQADGILTIRTTGGDTRHPIARDQRTVHEFNFGL